MRAAVYLRQSKDTEHTGLAVARQDQDCQRLAAERGWQVTATLTDNDLSASNGKHRPGYSTLLAMIDNKQVDVVVAWHVDRITRRLSDLEDLIERCEASGVRVATVSGDLDLSTDAGRLVGRILGAVARGEIERKSARQKRASVQAAEAGEVPSGRRAFGYHRDGTHHPDEAPAVAELFSQVVAGLSLAGGTRWLNDRGHLTTGGRPWDRPSVGTLIRNPRYAGLRTLNGEVVGPGKWSPIVSEELFRAAQEAAKRPGNAGGTSARRWLGSGLYRCHCGKAVVTNYGHPGRRIYQCEGIKHLARTAEPIDEVVTAAIVARLRRADLADLLAEDTREDVGALRSTAADLRLRLDQIAADYAEGLLTGRQVQVASAKVTDRLIEAERALADAGRGSRLAPMLGAADPGQAWLDADLDIQRAVLDTLATVTVLPGQRGRTPFDPESVRIEWKV
ncbi:recombinase family protein [soil metagenome]